MIEAKEMRLGNWVSLKFNTPTFDTVHFISDNTIGLSNYGGEWELQEIEPIELTPEILEKITGCEVMYKSQYTNKWDIRFDDRYIGVTYHVVDGQWAVTFGSHIVLLKPHFHVLQNVIFFNWGKELEITL